MNIKRNKMEWTGIGERPQKPSRCASNIVRLGEKGDNRGRQFQSRLRGQDGQVLMAGGRTAMYRWQTCPSTSWPHCQARKPTETAQASAGRRSHQSGNQPWKSVLEKYVDVPVSYAAFARKSHIVSCQRKRFLIGSCKHYHTLSWTL